MICAFFSKDFLDARKVNNYVVNVNSQKDQSPISPRDSSTICKRQEASDLRNSLNGPVESGTSGIRPRPTSLDLPLNHVHRKEESAPSKSRNSSLESFLIPCVPKHERYSNDGNKVRTPTASKSGRSVAREEAGLRSPSEVETQECDQPICRDCCKSLSTMENRLEKLSSCLERLESKFSTDVEAIFELLRAHSEAIRDRKLDFHTQV